MDLTAGSAQVFRAPRGQGLTSASQDTPAAVVADFLRSRGRSESTVSSLVTVNENPVQGRGLTHVRLEQRVNGLKVHGTYVKATVDAQGQLVHLIELLASPPVGRLLAALVSSRSALDTVVGFYYPGRVTGLREAGRDGNTVQYAHNGFFYQNPTVTRVAIAMANGGMEEGFLVETWTDQENLLHHTLISRSGRILGSELRTNTDSYNIFPDHPGNSTQTVTAGPGGWLFFVVQTTLDILGNNVHAYLDTNNNNASDGVGSSVTDGNFLTDADLGAEPGTGDNQAVAVQNLFYLNNIIHDKLYGHGFTESAGNFQEDNFGNGGNGSDSVNAEAQDGGGLNNANFATPADGSNPRMQMYIWTQSTPRRDGDLDSDIVLHEYGHGLTWRMIGNMSGPMPGAIGEGMGDTLSILINDNDVVGEYSFNNPVGIRSAPYTNYSRTYGDFSGNSVHFDGEIYAATIWRLWEIFQGEDLPQDTLFDYLIGGMNFTPAGPAMEDMRDGILQAASSSHECLIWEAFADFGIGEGARAKKQGGGPFGGRIRITESFTLPLECSGCVVTEPTEMSCTDGLDNDCDGLTDGDDPDCSGGVCVNSGGLPAGDGCSSGSECCSNKCKGKPGSKTCK